MRLKSLAWQTFHGRSLSLEFLDDADVFTASPTLLRSAYLTVICVAATMPGCSMEHGFLHREVLTLLGRSDVSGVTVEDLLDRLQELGMETTFDSGETSIVAMLVHMRNMMKELMHRRREGTITAEETARLFEAIYGLLNDSHRNLFTDDLSYEAAGSCMLSCAITLVLDEMKTLIERNHYYRSYCGTTFRDHVTQIKSCQFDLNTYELIITLHNLHVAVYEILEDRMTREFDRSTPVMDTSPRCDFNLRLVWNVGQDAFMLREDRKDGHGQSTIFHSSFLGILSSTSARIWRNRTTLGAVDFTCSHSCPVCLRGDVSTSDLTVLSGCTHLFCTECSEAWFDRSRRLSCPLCRTVSEERTMASGYGNLLRMIR